MFVCVCLRACVRACLCACSQRGRRKAAEGQVVSIGPRAGCKIVSAVSGELKRTVAGYSLARRVTHTVVEGRESEIDVWDRSSCIHDWRARFEERVCQHMSHTRDARRA